MTQPSILPIFDNGPLAYQLATRWSVVALGKEIVVPEGFISDGASVPRFLWWFTPPDGLHRAAALAHDFLYACKGRRPGYLPPLSRAECDNIFRALMLESFITSRRARTMWLAVRAFGWKPWRASSGIPRVEPPRYEIS